MKFVVSVEAVGGAGRIELLESDDADATASAVSYLISAARGRSWELVVAVQADAGGGEPPATPGGGTAAAAAQLTRPGQPAPKR